MSRRELLLESFEDRILCDATADAPKQEAVAVSTPDPVQVTAGSVDPSAGGVDTTTGQTAGETPAPTESSTATNSAGTTSDATAQLTDEQRQAIESVVRESTNTIWFQENVGQFEEGVRYGFRTQFGGMLVYDDHVRIISTQIDEATGEAGLHTIDLTFPGGQAWQIVPGQESGVLGTYQQADGTTLTPHLFQEITLRNVYDGIDLRLYSADRGVLEFDWLVARAQDYEKIRLNFTGQDGLIFNADGSAALDLRYQDLVLKMPEVYQVIDGEKHLLGAAMVAGDNPNEMRYSLSGEIVADAALVIDPNIAWATYFDLNDTTTNAFDSYLFAVQVNSSGVYCAGWVKEVITNGSYGNYMQVNAGYSVGTVANQNYVYRLNLTGTGITAWTSTGITGSTNGSSSSNPVTDLELFPDGRVLLSYRDSTIQIFSGNLASRIYSGQPTAMSTINSVAIVNDSTFYVGGLITAADTTVVPTSSGLDSAFAGGSEGIIVRYTVSGSTITRNWATYIGGDSTENFTAIALTPDGTKLVFAVHSNVGANYVATVNAVDSTAGGATEILTGVIAEQATKPTTFNVFSFLGGSGAEGSGSSAGVLVTASNTGYWVAGNTSSTDLPGTTGAAQTTLGGGTDSFLSYIPINGSLGTGFRTSYNGGAGNEIVGGIGYDSLRDRVFVFGTTSGSFPVTNTTPSSIFYQGTAGGGTDIFIATFTGNVATRDYATYIGGSGNDYLGNTGVLYGTGHVTYSSVTGQVYLATTVHSSLATTTIGGTIPGYDVGKSNGGNDVHVIFSFNVNLFDHGDAPTTYENGTAGEEAVSETIRLGASVDAESAAISGAAATGDDLTNNGAADDEDGITSTLPLMFTSDTTYSVNVSLLNNTGASRTLQGWIDLNRDGVFGLNERATATVTAGAAQQTVTLTWSTLPGITSGQSYLRLRFSEVVGTDNGATTIDERSVGTSTGHGEIEDYALIINALSSLSGFVYSELNGNTTKNTFEGGIPGTTITLTGTDIRGNAVSRTTTTDATGFYTFSNLIASNATGYTITETQPSGYNDGPDTIGTPGGTTGSDVFSGIVLAAGVNGANNNFGETPVFSLTKSLQTTSVAGTSGSNLAIGETATFRLVVNVPAGNFTDFQIQDALPTGFQYVNGSAVVSLVSSAGQLTSSTLSGAGLAQTSIGTPTFALPDAAVSASATSNLDTYASGTDVYFKLGNLANTETTSAVESVVIEFQAVVVNESANQAATSLANTFNVLFDKDGVGAPDTHGSSSNTVTTTVVEPVLGVSKTLVTSGSDAGDAVQYTITITNAAANNATAYDISVTDLFDTDFVLNNVTLGSGIVVSGAAVTTNSSTTSNLNLVLTSLAANSSATITLNGVVASTAPAGSTVSNTTSVSWTSTPGTNASERTGSGGINDYAATASSANFVLARPTVDKLTPSDTTYSVGESVTYDILVTLPEGVTRSLAITDNLPSGLIFESVAVQTAAGGVLATAFNGTVSSPTTTNVGNSYTFTLGDVTTTGDNVAGNNSFLLRVTARVANILANQNATTLTNTATLSYNDGTSGATTVNDATPNVNITVVEPLLTLDKQVVGTSTGLDAGDTVQYRVVISNTGTATAHEVTLSDALPSGLLVSAINSTTAAGSAAIDTATGGVGTATLTGEYTIPVGGSITIIYTATLQTAVTPNTNYVNTATVTFSSVNGTATGERVGTAPNIQGDGSLNDYRLTDTAQISTGGVLTIAKAVDNSTPSIGDVLNYTVTLTLNEGTTNGIVVTDTLPTSGDLQYVAGSAAVTFGTAGSTISGTATPVISGTNNNVLTFNLGSAAIPAGAGANTVVLSYQVLVRNVATNQAGDVEGNSASVIASSFTPPTPATTTVTLREPTVTLSKSASATTNIDAGDVITYTVTLTNPLGANASTAYDALLVDTMPANLRVTGITSTTTFGTVNVDSAAAITGGGTGLTGQYDIGVGGSVTIVYTATVQSGFAPGGSVTNNAVVTWTSKNGGNSTAPDANERYGAAGSLFGDGSLNDYRRTASVTSTGYGPTISKILFATSEAATTGTDLTIGETATYGLLVTLPEGTTPDLSVIDRLPTGLQYLSYSIVTTAAASSGILSADFAGTVPTPTTSGGATDGADVTFTFGSIAVTGDNDAASNSFLILVNARVLDEASNVGTNPPGRTTLVNDATLDIPSDANPVVTSNAISSTVAEPRLTITKGVNDATPDVGQTLTYTLTITHNSTSTADAFDILVRDAIPTGLTLNTASIAVSGATITANASTTTLLSLDLDGLAQGGTITVTFEATVANSVALANQTLSNNARIYWDTLAADEATNAILANTPDGTPDRDLGATDGYRETATPTPDDPGQDTADVVVNGISNTISGLVYRDVNQDGDYDVATDTLLDGVTVQLSGLDVSNNPVLLTTISVGGAYSFANLQPGTYTITETTPTGYVDGLETVGTTFGGAVSNALGSETISTITIPVGPSAVATDYNFGEVLTSSLSGFTYLDNNSNGIFSGEAALAGIPITLTGTDAYGQAVSLNATSGIDGSYSFTGLRPGVYTITEDDSAVVPGTYFDGKDTVGSAGGTLAGVAPKNDAINVTLSQDVTGTGYNFGEVEKSSLSGAVYLDLDNDGQRDVAETGVPGATIELSGTDDLGNSVNLTAVTDSNGGYSFNDLRPGTYTLTETQPFGYLDGQDTQGQPGNGTAGNDVFSSITLNGGVTGSGNNFGERFATTLTKSIVSTSLVATTGSDLAIGEVVRYRLTATMPYGTINDAQMADFLPDGLIFLDDGTATVGFVSPTGTALTSSIISGAGLTSITSPTVILGDSSISSSTTSDLDSYASGTDVFFKLGTLTNTTPGVDSGTVVIEFNARVVNEIGNQAGTLLDNSFGSRIDTDGDGASDALLGSSNTVSSTVVEPNLTIGKAATPNTNIVAGEVITYTVTFSNNGTSTAFDSVVTDTAPAYLQITGIVSTVLAGGATQDSAAAVTGGGTGLTGQYDVPVGGSVTITYTATVLATYPIGTQLVNTAELTWTSLPGGNSGTPDTGERFGVTPNIVGDGSLNDYRQVITNGVNGLPFIPQVQKAIVSTSEAGSVGTDVLVGEVVRFELRVELYQGSVALGTIRDFLPTGLQFLPDGPVEVAFEGVATSVTGFTAGIYTNATNDAFISSSLTTDDDNFGDGTDVFFKLGNIRNNDTDPDREFVVIRFNALVTNTAGNVAGTTLNNDFGVLADINGTGTPGFVSVDANNDGQATNSEVANDPTNNGTGTPGLSNTVSVTVIEPAVTVVAKTLTTATSGDAGDAVSYNIVVRNTGNGPAYDLVLGDAFDAALGGLAVTISSATPALAATDPVAQTATIVGNTILLSRLDAGQEVTLTVTATLTQSVTPGQVIGNSVTLQSYTSLPGTGTPIGTDNSTGSTTPGTSGTPTGERDGSGGVNDYTGGTQTAANVVVPAGQVSKSLFATSEAGTADPVVAIGEEVTYALLVTLPEGTTSGLVLTDQVPAGMQFVSASLVTTVAASGGLLTANFAGSVTAPTITGGATNGEDAILTFGAITVTGDNVAGNNSFIALVTMRVLDDAANSGINPPGQTTLGNVATLAIPSNPPVDTPPVNVTIVEPRLQISKSVNDTAVDLGQVLTYTLTIQHTAGSAATAFDLLVRETAPAGLTLNPASINVTSTSGNVVMTANNSTATTISVDLDALALGDVVTITYSATVGTSAALTGTNIDNNARLYWDTTSVDEVNAILTNTADGTSDRDFGATDGYVENATPLPDDLAQDTERVVVNSNLISGFVYIDADGNGVFGVENGVDGVTITLTGTDLNGNSVSRSVLTGGNGEFIFSNLAAGTYTLTQTQPANLTDALETVGVPFGGTTSNSYGSNVISDIVIATGDPQSGVGYNFGEVRPASILGTVYIDANNDGVLSGETGIAGITMTLSGTDIFGQAVLLTATTDASGNYTFDNAGVGLRPSDASGYTITQGVVPAPYLDGKETAGTLLGSTVVNDAISGIVLPQDTAATGYLFGELPPGSFSGVVYSDADNDGVKDAGENGIGGVTVTLTGTDDLGNSVNRTTTTAVGTGAYSFADLRPGNYTLTETQPTAFLDGRETLGSQASGVVDNSQDSNTIASIVLTTGVDGTANNFGELAPASLSGSVYADLDNDGVFDVGESGIPGVTVTLTGTDDRNNPVNLTLTTNAAGGYTFASLRPSNGAGYTISESPAAGYTDGIDTIGTPGGTAANDVFSAIILTAGTDSAANNFGERPIFVLTKSLASTSEAGTSGSDVTIGEVATFRLVVTIPAGSLTNFQVQDLLPAGYQYVNGTARAGLVGALTSSTLTAPLATIGSTPTVLLADAAVSASVSANTDAYASGTDVFFKFGTITNTDTTAAVEAIVIEFDAVVLNEAANVAGHNLPNSFHILYDADGVGDPDVNATNSNTVTTRVVAPVLTLDKDATPVGVIEAGSEVTYTLTIANTGGSINSEAFDALITDVAPPDIFITSISSVTVTSGVVTDSAVAITGGGLGLRGQFDIPVGGSVTITYIGTVQSSAIPGTAETNTAELTWTSLNGSNSLTPDAGERSGAAGTLFGDANLNNLRRVDTHVVTIGTAGFDKDFFGMSDPATPGTDVAIGETVTYALIVTLPAGTAPSLVAIDTLPAGLQYLSSSIVTTAVGSNGLLTQDFAGTVPDPTVTGGVGDGDDVTFTFGAIVTNADGNSSNNTFLILVNTRVTDVATNSGLPPGQTTLSNTATFDIPEDPLPEVVTPPVDVTVVEPKLTIDKEFDVTEADAGDTVLITITVENTGTGPAYDVVVTDAVDLTKFGNITEVTTVSGFTFNNTAGVVTYSGGTISYGGSVSFVFSAVLLDDVNATETLSNTASVIASTQPGVVVGERTLAPVQDTDTLTVPGVLDVTKSIVAPGATVQVGDTVTYSVVVRVVEGTTNGLSFVDTLPANMSYVAGSATISAIAPGMIVNGFAANVAAGVLTMTATSVVNIGDVDDTATVDGDTFTITYQAVVNDVVGNANGATLVNDLDATATGGLADLNNTATATVVEPQLKVTKAVNDSTADLGQVLHFTLTISHTAASTATAYDILVRDALPAGLSGLTNITVNGATEDANNSTSTTLDLKLSELALGGTVTVEFDATVGTGVGLVGTAIDNNARVYWDSQAGESSNAVLTGTADGNEDRDYGATGANEVFNLDTQDAQDTERLTVNGSTLTGVVYHDADASGTFVGGTDSGLAGQTVRLTGTTAFGETVDLVAVTGPGGIYTFSNLAPSDAAGYTLTQTQPTGYVDALETAGTVYGGTVSAVLGSNTITQVSIGAGANSDSGFNFGEVLPSSLAGSVYSDTNNDGTRQVGEAGLNLVPLLLTGTDVFGQAVSIIGTTDTNGNFVFDNGVGGLRPGTYKIAETAQPTGYLDGKETAGTASGDATTTNEEISAITLAQNTTATGYLFGELRPASLSGFVYADLDTDGVKDAGESGLQGVTVTLTGTDDLGQSVSLSQVTDATGAYSFTDLRPGQYVISETQPAGFGDGAETLGTGLVAPNNPGAVGADTFTGIQIANVAAGNDSGVDYNFGETPLFNPTKSLVSTSSTSTTGSNVAIGETVTFRLVVNVPQGSLANFQIQDVLPAGYAYVNGSARAGLVSAPGQLTSSAVAAPLTDINATPTAVLPDAAVSTDPATNDDTYLSGTAVYFKLGTLTNTDISAATVEGVVIEFDAIVVNEGLVQSGSTLVNSFNVLYDKDGDGTPDTNPTPSNSVPTTVVEPDLAIAKTITTATSQVEAGDTVTYQIVVQHSGASTADAFDLNISDLIPAQLGNVTLDSALIGATNVAASLNLTGNTLTTTGDIDLLQGQTLVITISGKVRDSVAPATVISNSATVTYTSIDGTVTGERNGGGGVNDYTGTAIAPEVTTVGTLVVSKTADKTAATIGETVKYTVSVTVGEGTTNNLTLTDTLPAGMQFVSGSAAIATNPAGMTITGFDANSIGQTLTIVNPGDVDDAAGLDSDTFTITYEAIVLDVVGNTSGTSLVNDLDATADNLPPDLNNQASITVSEPQLSVTKTAGVSSANIGDTVTYTLLVTHSAASSSDAFDVLVRDAIPSGFTLNLASVSVTGATLDADTSTTSQLDLKLSGLPLGSSATITFTVTIAADPALVGTTVDNNARVYWDTQASESTNTVLAGGVDGDADRDYGATGPDEIFSANSQDAQDTERISIAANTLTGVAYQDVNADGDYDAGTDTLLDGVQITLTGTLAADGSPFTATATSVGGVYIFNNLPAGTFTLTETQPTGYVDAAETVGTLFGGSVSTVLDSNTITDVVIPSGSVNATGYNFGEVLGSSITGSVFVDANNDGVRTGEAGLQGVAVELTGTDLLGESVTLSGTSLADGTYVFGGGQTLRPGTYTVTELAQPAGYLDGKESAGAAGGDVSVNEVISGIALLQGTTAADNVFGELEPSSIAGFVFVDGNGDAIKDPTEQGIAGVTVQLIGTDDLGADVDITVTTGADGGFTFTNLRPGSYTLIETQPPDYTDGPDKEGTAGGDVSTNDQIAAIKLGPGTNATNYSFVEVPIPIVVPRPPVEESRPPQPQPQPAPPFVFAFDTFNNFADSNPLGPVPLRVSPVDIWRPAMLPLAPIYSGAANPGATLVIDLYNANGVHIGSQTVIADSGGNWLANFTSVVLRDAPSEVRITQANAPYSFGSGTGHNLRTYYAPAALNPGHFLAQSISGGSHDDDAPLLGGLDLANPIALGSSKYGGEFLAAEGVASSN